MPLQRREFLKRLTAGIAAIGGFFRTGLSVAPPTDATVRRLVLIKVDGLPHRLVDAFVRETDSRTGKSALPWFKHLFYEQGARLTNFYVRGMSLSAPSWSLLDTGQHLQIKGNVEFDRLTLHAYDYLNFIPFYLENAAGKRVDMPGTEVLDELGVPLLVDAFAYNERYQSFQLYQRGVHWTTFERGLKNRIKTLGAREVIDEWTMGFESRSIVADQLERELIDKLKDPRVRYLDYYTTEVDHRTHHNRDRESQLAAVQDVDGTIGRIWTAIQDSPLAKETVLVVVSDHGTNTHEHIYAQGYNLVKLLGSLAGGGHHVITKRRLMMDYAIKGIYPLVPLITTTSSDSYYLKGQSTAYPTALLDFDGNERAAIHLRNNDLNVLHILLQQLQSEKLSPVLRQATINTFFATIDRRRDEWRRLLQELKEESGAFSDLIEEQREVAGRQPGQWTQADRDAGRDQAARRESARLASWTSAQRSYLTYLQTLSNLLALDPKHFSPTEIKIENVIAKGSMGPRNTIHQLQNYVVGIAPGSLMQVTDGSLDCADSFLRVNYFSLLRGIRVRNNVQEGVNNAPVDFIAVNVAPELLQGNFAGDLKAEEAIWLYQEQDSQALILSRRENDSLKLRYVPVARLIQQVTGSVSLDRLTWRTGLPLKIWEDRNLKIPSGDREQWLSDWHSEHEWIRAVHQTQYSNGIIGLHEQFSRHVTEAIDECRPNLSNHDRLLRRFRRRQRQLVEPDLFVHSNNHWNFDVRGFNPGANHGSFLRVSTHSTLMLAGGEKTGIRPGLIIEEPYDSLDLVPTLLSLTSQLNGKDPTPSLRERGFRPFPGRVIAELF